MRLNAYHYTFYATGEEMIDRVISAVACAGKMFHNTCDWNDECEAWEPFLRGATPAEQIQNAAEDAATSMAALSARVAALEAALGEALNGWAEADGSNYDGDRIATLRSVLTGKAAP